MEIRHLLAVLVVARLKNFNLAAFELYCSQSSVSRQIKSVENELNVTLFQRSSNSNTVQLTKQGELLLPQIRSIVDGYQELEEMAKIHEQESKALFRLGVGTHSFSADMKSTLAAKLYMDYPELILQLEDVERSQFFDCLTLHKLDAVLFYQACWNDEPPEPPEHSDDIICIPIAKVNLSIGLGKKHPLAAHQTVTTKMLENEKFIFNTDTINMSDERPLNQHGMFMKMCGMAGFTPEVLRVDRDLVNAKLYLAAQNKGVFPSFMPSSLCSYRGVAHVLVSDAPYYAQYYLLAAPGQRNRKLIEKFATFLQRVI